MQDSTFKIQRTNQNKKRTPSCNPEEPCSINLCVNNGDLFPVTCFEVIFQNFILKDFFLSLVGKKLWKEFWWSLFFFQRIQWKENKEWKTQDLPHFCNKLFFQLMLFLSPYNFISALFIDKTVLSLTYYVGKHWSLKDELFSACTILRAVGFFPRTGTQNLCWHQIHTKCSSTSSMVFSTYSETTHLWGGCWGSVSGFCLGSQI